MMTIFLRLWCISDYNGKPLSGTAVFRANQGCYTLLLVCAIFGYIHTSSNLFGLSPLKHECWLSREYSHFYISWLHKKASSVPVGCLHGESIAQKYTGGSHRQTFLFFLIGYSDRPSYWAAWPAGGWRGNRPHRNLAGKHPGKLLGHRPPEGAPSPPTCFPRVVDCRPISC